LNCLWISWETSSFPLAGFSMQMRRKAAANDDIILAS
jgi:hypothetical protein